ncbi:MAG: signal peptidase I [Myxococcaceae bacterium]|nr:signal peptidase I [Myxococcaceae bacterium]
MAKKPDSSSGAREKPFWQELENHLPAQALPAWKNAHRMQMWTSLWTPLTVLAIAVGIYMIIVESATCSYLWLQMPMKLLGLAAVLSWFGLVLLFGGPAAWWNIRLGPLNFGQWGGPLGARGVELLLAAAVSWADDYRLTGALFGLGFGLVLEFRGFHPLRFARRDRYAAEELLNELSACLRGKNVPDKVRQDLWKAADAVALAFATQPEKLAETTKALDELLEKHQTVLKTGTTAELAGGFGKALLVALLIRGVVLEPFKIPSGSMIPTLEIGDQIFVNKFIYGVQIPFTHYTLPLKVREPKRGDVIVFKNEHSNPEVDYVKRVIGLPGDRVEQKGHLIFINGQPFGRQVEVADYRYMTRDVERSKAWYPDVSVLSRETIDGKVHRALNNGEGSDHWPQPAVVPPGTVMVMGDNREHSLDSRFGLGGRGGVAFVRYGSIKGKAMVIWLSLSHGGFLSSFFEGTGIRTDRFFKPVDMCGNEPPPPPEP